MRHERKRVDENEDKEFRRKREICLGDFGWGKLEV